MTDHIVGVALILAGVFWSVLSSFAASMGRPWVCGLVLAAVGIYLLV